MENESTKVKNDTPPILSNLSYIIIRKPPKVNQYSPIDTAFADFLWCIKARSKDIFRPNITGILVEPAKIVATDGLQLHLVTNPYSSISPGEYEVYGINQSKVILIAKPHSAAPEFPKWNRAEITMEGNKPKHEITVNHPSSLYREILKHRIVDLKLLEDAISYEPMNVKIYGNTQPVIISTLTRTAIVMTIKDN